MELSLIDQLVVEARCFAFLNAPCALGLVEHRLVVGS